MKKVFLLSAVLLFMLGTVLVLSSYFLLNQYSLSDSTYFSKTGTYRFPNIPLELSQGDKMTFRALTDDVDATTFSIETIEEQKFLAMDKLTAISLPIIMFNLMISTTVAYRFLLLPFQKD